MSYNQAMAWHKKHPRGGKSQYLGFAPSSGFWPSGAWLRNVYWPYLEECKANGIEPLSAKDVYGQSMK
jgi:hypothetical protein